MPRHAHNRTRYLTAAAFACLMTVAACASYRPVQLAWEDQNPNKTVYRIERREGLTGPYRLIATLPPGSTGFTDPEAKAGTQYFYRIQAVTPDGKVLYSNEIAARPTAP
jgi:hypothetical protein